jgi:isoquinoline 1-oxidoreductase beta subunit
MYRPYYYDRLAAAVDDAGMPIAWSHRIVGSSIMARWAPPLFKDGIDPDAIDGAADMPYTIENFRVEYVREEPPGIQTAFWRGVGPTHNVYVIESFIDELAAAAKKDPVEFRRALLQKNPRALHVLNRAAELSNWGKPLGPRQGRGVSVQQAFGTYMCQVAEVTVSKAGEVHVDRVYVVLDTGVVVNPNTVAAQMQSGVIFGLSAVLWGEITLDKGRVQQSNFDDYRVMRIDEAPKIVIEIVKSEADPGGIGEPGTSGLAPAVLNAVYAATGVRLRKTPIDSKQLKEAS